MLIQILNNSTLVKDSDISSWISDLESQANNDLQKYWNSETINIISYAKGSGLDSTKPYISVEDNSDVQGALGYHSIDSNGVPFIKVFAKDSADAGVALSSVVSHEILELLVDPLTDRFAVNIYPNGVFADLYITEDCDPVEDLSYNGANGTVLSDFVTPAWFDSSLSGPWDFLSALPGPFTTTGGGYASSIPIIMIPSPVSGLGGVKNFLDKIKDKGHKIFKKK